MHSKEKVAWAWMVSLLLAPAIYFAGLKNIAWVPGNAEWSRLTALSMPLIVMALVALGVRAWNALQARHQGQDLVDERDQLIELKSTSQAYHVMVMGMVLVGMVMPFSASRWEIIDTAFFVIVLAEVVHCVWIILAYRRGIHA